MDYLNQQGETVYLKATTDIICKHLNMSKNVRPLLAGKSPDEVKAFVDEQISKRNAFYMKAKHILEVHLMDNREKVNTMAEQLIAMTGISKKT